MSKRKSEQEVVDMFADLFNQMVGVQEEDAQGGRLVSYIRRQAE